MERQLTVDFNRAVDGSLIRANTRRANAVVACVPGLIIVVGDNDWGVVQDEVVDHDPETGSIILRPLGDLIDERSESVAAV